MVRFKYFQRNFLIFRFRVDTVRTRGVNDFVAVLFRFITPAFEFYRGAGDIGYLLFEPGERVE